MDAFERNLQKLTDLINASEDAELKKAFAEYLESFNASMKTYLQFLSIMRGFESPMEKWDTEVVVRHEQNKQK